MFVIWSLILTMIFILIQSNNWIKICNICWDIDIINPNINDSKLTQMQLIEYLSIRNAQRLELWQPICVASIYQRNVNAKNVHCNWCFRNMFSHMHQLNECWKFSSFMLKTLLLVIWNVCLFGVASFLIYDTYEIMACIVNAANMLMIGIALIYFTNIHLDYLLNIGVSYISSTVINSNYDFFFGQGSKKLDLVIIFNHWSLLVVGTR